MSTFVSVGNAHQPFSRLLNQVLELRHLLPHPIIVQSGHTTCTSPDFDIRPFLDMAEFAALVGSSEILIMHAGAGSIITALDQGKQPIVVPRRARLGEHVDDHQVEFAEQMGRLKKVVFTDDLADVLDRRPGAANPRVDASSRDPPLIGLIEEILLQASR